MAGLHVGARRWTDNPEDERMHRMKLLGWPSESPDNLQAWMLGEEAVAVSAAEEDRRYAIDDGGELPSHGLLSLFLLRAGARPWLVMSGLLMARSRRPIGCCLGPGRSTSDATR